MAPGTTKSPPPPSEGEGGEGELSEEEERVNDEVLAHPTRDDLHEQRERGQRVEAVLHVHIHVVQWKPRSSGSP